MNNMTMKYLHCYDHRNITQLLLAKKKKRKRLYYMINYAGSTERQKAATE